MSDYIKKIRTTTGDKQIDYNALANLPTIPKYDVATPATDGLMSAKDKEKLNNISKVKSYIIAGVTDQELDDVINDAFSEMNDDSSAIICIGINDNGTSLAGGVWFIRVNKMNSKHGVLTANCYWTPQLIKQRAISGGVWGKWYTFTGSVV